MNRITMAAGLSLAAGSLLAMDVVKDGKPVAAIWYEQAPTNAAGMTVQKAAEELAGVIEKMSGARPDLHAVEPGAKPAIAPPAVVLGSLADARGAGMKLKSRAGDGYRIAEKDGVLGIAGESPAGVYNGVVVLLESWGCGWYAPGFVGEVIPAQRTLSVAAGLDRSEVSDSVNRRFWYGGKGLATPVGRSWIARNKGDLDVGSWNHAWAGLVSKDLFKEHPEYFAVKRGARNPGQLCTRNPETVRIAAESLLAKMAKNPELTVYPAGPNDGGGLCECPECAKLDTPGYIEPSSGKPAAGDRVFQFASELAERTAKVYPDKDLGILIYSEYSRPLLKMTNLNPNVFPMFAPIRRCRLHGPGHPGCYWSELWADEIRAWGKQSKKMGFYIYNYNLADALLPLSKITYYKEMMKAAHEAGAEQTAWIFETIDAWSSHAPHLYLSVRLSWNSNIDIDAEMDRYFKGFYGAAAEPMRNYWMRIDKAYSDVPSHTGSSYSQHHIWTPELLKACHADIAEAGRLAANPREKEAVAMAAAGLQFADLYMRSWNALGAFDFVEAGKAAAELKSGVSNLVAKTDPCWVHERYSWGYFARFVGETVFGGEKVIKDGGTILVKLPDVWKFKKDEKAEGVAAGWFQADLPDDDWGTLATFSKSWDDQGIRSYFGDAWYRARFAAPADLTGDLRLWFGGFDENVDVYLNGQSLGEKKGFARPAEYADIGKYLKPGENTLAVRVAAGPLAEMGTGGIMMPVMIYRAKAAAAAPAGAPAKGKGAEYEM